MFVVIIDIIAANDAICCSNIKYSLFDWNLSFAVWVRSVT